jgi:hypothetical protein
MRAAQSTRHAEQSHVQRQPFVNAVLYFEAISASTKDIRRNFWQRRTPMHPDVATSCSSSQISAFLGMIQRYSEIV